MMTSGDMCSPVRPTHYLKELKKRACELSPSISLSKTHKTLQVLRPLWARVGRANTDVMDLSDVLSKLRAENADLKGRLMGYVRMRAPPSSSQDIQLQGPPPGYPARNKFGLLPPVETRL